MQTKLWEATISGQQIDAGAVLWVDGDPTRIRDRQPEEKMQVYFRVHVTSRGGQNLKITCRGQDSCVWPGTSAFAASAEWLGTAVGADATVTADNTTVRRQDKNWVPCAGFRPQLRIENLGGVAATPTIQVECWIKE